MATGSANSRRQTITATAPFSPRKPGNKACQNGAKATNALCIHWVFLQSVPFTQVRSSPGLVSQVAARHLWTIGHVYHRSLYVITYRCGLQRRNRVVEQDRDLPGNQNNNIAQARECLRQRREGPLSSIAKSG